MMATLIYLMSFFSIAPGDANCGEGQTCSTDLPVVHTDQNQLQNVLAIVFGIVAAISVLMIVIAGFRFVTAQGNAQETAKARSTIVSAVIGLLVAVTAEGIVALVLGHL